MALRINSNVASVFSQKHVSRSQERLAENFAHLSSGLRVTKAADDAAGLAVSESMRADIRSLGTAMRNTNDGISMVQTGEASLAEIGASLSRMRELAVQSSSVVLQAAERDAVERYLADKWSILLPADKQAAEQAAYKYPNLTPSPSQLGRVSYDLKTSFSNEPMN